VAAPKIVDPDTDVAVGVPDDELGREEGREDVEARRVFRDGLERR